MSETFVSRKHQLEMSIEATQALHSEQGENTNGNRSLVEAQEKLITLHVGEEEREAAAEQKAVQDAIILQNLKVSDIGAYGYVRSGYIGTINNTSSDWGTVQSEDHMYREVTGAMGMRPRNKAGAVLNLNDVGYKTMPYLLNGKSFLSLKYEPRPDDQSSNAYSYPDNGGWLIPFRNTTDADITINLPTVMSSYSSNYSSAVISIFTPNADNSDPSLITEVIFTNVMYYTGSSADRDYTQQIVVPANTTILVMVQASARYNGDVGEAYQMSFICNVSLEEALATEGIRIDAGLLNNMNSGRLNEVHQLFQYFDGITNWTDGTESQT